MVRISNVIITEKFLAVDLVDGRTISVPIGWYPRLEAATLAERANWRLIGQGEGIHWPDLDEDVSAANLVAGHPSSESQSSLIKWKEERSRGSMTAT